MVGYWGARRCMRPYVGTKKAHCVSLHSTVRIVQGSLAVTRHNVMVDSRSSISLDSEELKWY